MEVHKKKGGLGRCFESGFQARGDLAARHSKFGLVDVGGGGLEGVGNH